MKIYAGIASDPEALPDDRSFIAFTVSETVGSSSCSGLHSTCGSLLIASSLIDDGRLRTKSMCSAHLFKIASLSVRRLDPSALRSGVVLELWGPYTVLSASKSFFMSFLSAKDWVSSAFFLNQESCLPELRYHQQSFLPQTSLVLSATGSLELRLVSSAILEHTNNNTSHS